MLQILYRGGVNPFVVRADTHPVLLWRWGLFPEELVEDVFQGLTAVEAIFEHEVLHLLGHLVVQSNLEKTAPSLQISSSLLVLFDVDWLGCDVEVISHLDQLPSISYF